MMNKKSQKPFKGKYLELSSYLSTFDLRILNAFSEYALKNRWNYNKTEEIDKDFVHFIVDMNHWVNALLGLSKKEKGSSTIINPYKGMDHNHLATLSEKDDTFEFHLTYALHDFFFYSGARPCASIFIKECLPPSMAATTFERHASDFLERYIKRWKLLMKKPEK